VKAKLGIAFSLSLVDDTGLANLPPSNPGMLQSVLITDQKSEQNPDGTLPRELLDFWFGQSLDIPLTFIDWLRNYMGGMCHPITAWRDSH